MSLEGEGHAVCVQPALKVWRRVRLDALQACKPSDIFWPLAILFRSTGGTKFVFDQHDLCPELYESRFPDKSRLPYWACGSSSDAPTGLPTTSRTTLHRALKGVLLRAELPTAEPLSGGADGMLMAARSRQRRQGRESTGRD